MSTLLDMKYIQKVASVLNMILKWEKVCIIINKVCTYYWYVFKCVHTLIITNKRCAYCAHSHVTKNKLRNVYVFYTLYINQFNVLPFLSWRKDRSRPASSSMLLCRGRHEELEEGCQPPCIAREQSVPQTFFHFLYILDTPD
jgi:hypothetical protein